MADINKDKNVHLRDAFPESHGKEKGTGSTTRYDSSKNVYRNPGILNSCQKTINPVGYTNQSIYMDHYSICKRRIDIEVNLLSVRVILETRAP